MGIHIDGSGNVNNTPIRKQENTQKEEKVFSIFDVNHDGEVSTSEQMQQVDQKASSLGKYTGVWYSHIARFFQNTISYITNSTAAQKANQIVQGCIDNAMKFLQHCVNKGDESPFTKESTEFVTCDDGNITEAPNSYTSSRNGDGERVTNWNDGTVYTYSQENDFLRTKLEQDGETYTYKYNDDGSYTKTRSDGTIWGYDSNGECISRNNPDGTSYTKSYNEDGSYTKKISDGTVYGYDSNGECISRNNPDGTSYTFSYNDNGSYTTYNADTQTWDSSWHKDNTLMGELTQNGNYKFHPSSSISIADAAQMLGVDENQLRSANPKAARAGEFAPPNDIYVPKWLLPKDFDPSKVIV